MDSEHAPNYAELAPLPVEDSDDDGVPTPPPPPPPPPAPTAQQQLRVEAKPFTPFGNTNPAVADAGHFNEMQMNDDDYSGYDEYQQHYNYHRRPQQPPRQVSVTRAHYDEEGNVVYPARVTVVQNPGVMRMIAERDVRKGFRENSKKPGLNQFGQQQQQHVLVQTPMGPMMMPVLAPVVAQHAQQQQQNHQPAFAVFNRQQQPSTSAPSAPLSGVAAPIVAPPFGPDDQVRSLASALMDPIMNPPPKYVAYNPFADTTLDTMKSSLDTLLQDDDDHATAGGAEESSKTRRAGSEDGSATVDPLWLLSEVKRVEGDTAATAGQNNNAAGILASALLGLPALAPRTQRAVEDNSTTPEPIGPRPGGIGAFGSAQPAPPPPRYAGSHFGMSQNVALLPPPPEYAPIPATSPQPNSGSVLPAPPPPPVAPSTVTSNPSTFVPNMSAKPFVPGAGMASTMNLPTYTDSMSLSSAPTQMYRHTSSANTTIQSNSSNSIGPRHDESGNLNDSRALGDESQSMSNLKINPDAFFAASGQSNNNRTNSQGHQPINPFSLQSLQGVRRAEHAIPFQQVVWQNVQFGGSSTWVPPVFPAIPDETVRLYNGSAHYGVTRPLTHPNVTLHLYDYQCTNCSLSHIYPGKVHERPADVKLGGICGDVPALSIAHLIEVITGVKIVAIDMFGNNLGRCNLWLQNPHEIVELTKKFDRKMWMSPVYHQYAVVALDEDGKEFLHWYLEGLRTFGPKSVRFPRHLVTCERWIA
jgi:hypothetical protein